MKIPKKIKVGALIYKIKIVDKVVDKDRADYYGLTNQIKEEIWIKKGSKRGQYSTFLHELLHAINNEVKNEEWIQSMADGLHQIIKDNPGVFK